MKPVDRFCELGNTQASLYCASDAAFLCWSCDVKVHQANFLVARHVRRIICSMCKGLTGNPVFEFCLPQSESASFCASCSLASSQIDHLDYISSLSNCDCVSSTMSCTTSQKKADADRRKICSNSSNYLSSVGCGEAISSQRRSRASILDMKAEGVLVYWCRKLGLSGDRAVRLGRNALTLCWDQMTVLPFRVSLAASLMHALPCSGDGFATGDGSKNARGCIALSSEFPN